MFSTLQFEEAIRYLRGKANLPTAKWSDLIGAAHARSFTVAGATRLALLQDFRTAIAEAIAQGQSIGPFRKEFDRLVTKYGWSYHGTRGWRTRVIYDTNLRSAHMAGRWEQVQRQKATRPYLQYQTAGDSNVRPEHQEWDGIILPIDDPWWSTHLPLNGWGCRCTVRSLSERQIEQEGLKISESAPPLDLEHRFGINGEDFGLVPRGIDVGFDYNVGQAWMGADVSYGRELMAVPADMRALVLESTSSLAKPLSLSTASWLADLPVGPAAADAYAVTGYARAALADTFAGVSGIAQTALLRLSADVAQALLSAGFTIAEVARIPRVLSSPEKIIQTGKDTAAMIGLGLVVRIKLQPPPAVAQEVIGLQRLAESGEPAGITL